ncbi:MAG: hypothetical protein J6N21_19345 [Butyrivibrio sp.]|nr:hypothetical protein [Butyrivibrio sp.]
MSNSENEFSISKADVEKFKRFDIQHRKCPVGPVADKYAYTFVSTSLGVAITVKCSCGQKILLGDVWDKDIVGVIEEEHKPMTEQDLANQRFEDDALGIIRLKDPNVYRMVFNAEQSFDIIYAYAMGVAEKADERISKAILYRIGLDEYYGTKQNYPGNDTENIQRFYTHFEQNIRDEIKKYNCKNIELLDELYPKESLWR